MDLAFGKRRATRAITDYMDSDFAGYLDRRRSLTSYAFNFGVAPSVGKCNHGQWFLYRRLNQSIWHHSRQSRKLFGSKVCSLIWDCNKRRLMFSVSITVQ